MPSTCTPLTSLQLPAIHGFFLRTGGVSQGIFASLNCGPGSGDTLEHVAENRARCAQALGVELSHFVTAGQVHGREVVTVTTPWAMDSPPEADALVTSTPGMALGILTADCGPVLLADTEAGVIGAAHAGWKGALGGVTDAVISAMETLGAARTRIAAAIGPCIAQESYEVDAGFRERFLDVRAENDGFFIPSKRADHFRFDLRGYIAHRLKMAEITSVDVLPHDTCADAEQFFSYRRTCLAGDTQFGRQVSAIALPTSRD